MQYIKCIYLQVKSFVFIIFSTDWPGDFGFNVTFAAQDMNNSKTLNWVVSKLLCLKPTIINFSSFGTNNYGVILELSKTM